MLGKDQPAAQDNGGESSGARNIPGNGNSSNSNSSGPNIGTVTSNNGGMASGDPAAEFQAEFVCKQRFADNFWSLDERCISVLMHKLKNAKQTSCDILQMVSTRATMEDDLGKKLAKLSRAGLGTEEVGSIKDALRTVRAEMESNAKCHLELARQLRTEIEKPLSSFINDQRAKRRAQTSIIQKTEGDRNSLRSQLRKLQDKRRGDTKKVGDLDLQVNGLQGVGDPKLRTKLDRAQMQQKATENEYVDVRERLKDADQQWYNVWRSACDVFQVLEEERIEYLKTCLWTFTNLISSSCVADDESMERIRQDLEKISVADDIAEFIQTFGTGAPDPELALGQPAAGGDTDRGRGRGRGGDRGRGGGGGGHNYNHSNGQQPQHNSSDSDDAGNADNALNSGAQMHRPTPSTGGQGSAIPAPAPAPVTSSPVSSFSPGTAMTPEHPAYPKRSSTPNSISNSNNTFPSIGTSGTARSGSILAPSMSSRPQTQESIRQQHQQQQRPVSMHAAAAGNPPISGSPALHGQAQHLFNANSNWNSRPVSSMQGSIGANSNFRRASNNDMYAMGAGNHQQQPQPQSQQQQQP
ncbi:formin-binding protein, partial [Kickxella alabastrina]